MTEKNLGSQDSTEPVALTLQIDPKVYQAFVRKAQQAGTDVETFLTNTLTVVLGCRAFDSRYSSCMAKQCDEQAPTASA